ncbi:MAG TPA: hypothetical protein VMV19_15595 [Xanthobacteraceae bacterium]|nr:hypothetical protein [Xanthobacteraceae bacterium]
MKALNGSFGVVERTRASVGARGPTNKTVGIFVGICRPCWYRRGFEPIVELTCMFAETTP